MQVMRKVCSPILDEKLCHSMLVIEGIHWLSPANNNVEKSIKNKRFKPEHDFSLAACQRSFKID